MIDIGLLILRIGISLMLIKISFGKLKNYSEWLTKFPAPFNWNVKTSLNITLTIQIICSLLLILGLFTQLAAFALFAMMCIIVLEVHKGYSYEEHEFVLHYLLIYLAIFFTGAGKYSLDSYINISLF
ncbi:DoxX family protein [Aureibacter tunicatorum]|uniref:Oxidoreductase n=1 Tax=Aureibacter tunicatorum TaxID=866807 RepID=A0AAE3XPU1_9BACT|nr:DoxX family protein [Aureibacter tunicatorum]MDR6239119.1 putative oxidoreductase [Aureibacter tunicatorum]BDD04955.1 hypothetical protein AUTU_24380 [Aureibacter tunicatorum]